MTRFTDILFGACLGAVATGAAVVLAEVPTMDPVKLSPQYYKVRLDNARVRVLEYRLKPGEKEVMHSHPEGVVFVLADVSIKTTRAEGTVDTHSSLQGDVTWRDALTHSAENVGTTEAHAWAVELKHSAK